MLRGVRALVDRRARLRWMHLLLGAALLMPFQLLMTSAVGTTGLAGADSTLAAQLLAFALALPLVAAAGLLPVARSLEGAMARTLCGATGEVLASPADTWAARRRTSVWFTLHAALGGITGALSLALPPAGVLLLLLPWLGRRAAGLAWASPLARHLWVAPLVGLLLIALPVTLSYGAGRCLARFAPLLLGPTPADRLAEARRRADLMAERNRVARELHDSVGHALSAVGVQAAAAARLLHSDPGFAATALAAIEDTAREAVAELDHVLGLLRDDAEGGIGAGGSGGGDGGAPRTLTDLPALLDRTRAAGAVVDYADDGLRPATLPGTVSREAYRIVQEGLANALKHAGPDAGSGSGSAPIEVRLTVRQDTLEMTVLNRMPDATPGPTPARRTRSRPGGGNGLVGLHERVALLRGTLVAGPDGSGCWLLTARLPLSGGGA